jgi:hypothetical protein
MTRCQRLAPNPHRTGLIASLLHNAARGLRSQTARKPPRDSSGTDSSRCLLRRLHSQRVIHGCPCGMGQPWRQWPPRRRHRIGLYRPGIWCRSKPLLRQDAAHAGQGSQAVGRRTRSASTASSRETARTRVTCHVAKINVVSKGVSDTACSRRRCTDRLVSHMLSLRHSIGKRSRFVPLTEEVKSVPPFHCYTSPNPAQTFSKKRYKLIFLYIPTPNLWVSAAGPYIATFHS